MNFNRVGHREDVLFVIALVVPAIFAGARYFESEHQMTQIARARSQSALIAEGRQAPAQLRLVQVERPAGETLASDAKPAVNRPGIHARK